MANQLRDVCIAKNSGITVFYHGFNDNFDRQLIGGLTRAVLILAEKISDGEISSFDLKGKRFTVLEHGSFMFMATSSDKARKRKVTEDLKSIAHKFYIKYSEDALKDCDIKTYIFDDFIDEIREELELNERVESFWSI